MNYRTAMVSALVLTSPLMLKEYEVLVPDYTGYLDRKIEH